jgi:hypothetical protein
MCLARIENRRCPKPVKGLRVRHQHIEEQELLPGQIRGGRMLATVQTR